MRAPLSHIALPALLAAFVLVGCQDTAENTPVTETEESTAASCVVTADDLDVLEAQFQARFKTISGVLLMGDMPKEGLVERLDVPFSGEIKSDATAVTKDNADASLSWTVPLDAGCELPTDGSDDPSLMRPAVTAIRLQGRKTAQSEFYFEPMHLITDK